MIQQRIINNSFTEIYVEGGGNWITQSFPTNFHTFERKHILDKGESIDDWREVSDSEKAELEKADAEWERPSRLFIYLWNLACQSNGKYNEATGYFELNGITDISYKEALMIYSCYGRLYIYNKPIYTSKEVRDTIRTIIPEVGAIGVGYSGSANCFFENKFLNMSNLRIVNTGESIQLCGGYRCFQGCKNLETIENPIYGTNANPNVPYMFNGCESLRNVKIAFNRNFQNFSGFPSSPLLSLESLRYLVDNSTPTSVFTVPVHPVVYAKLTDEGNSEWHKVWQDAQDKQISFATS